MDINEDRIKEELSSILNSLQRLLPKKKEIIDIAPQKSIVTKLRDIHAEAKDVFPKCFFGARLVILREIMNKVKLVQQYNYGKPKDTYKSYSKLIHKESKRNITDDGLVIDSTGSATAIYSEVLDDDLKMTLTSKIRDLISSETELVLEKEGKNTIGCISYYIKDVDPSTFKMVTQLVYKILPDILIGTEVSVRPLESPILDFSISSRYERPSFTFSSTVSRYGIQLCLWNQFSSDLRIAAIVNESMRSSTVGVALHKSYNNNGELKIFVDSQRCGGFTFQKDIFLYEPHNEVRVLRFIGSTLIDRQRRVRFGFGINLEF